MSDETNFLARWSRRKIEARRGRTRVLEEGDAAPDRPPAETAPDADAGPAPADEDLPDPETLSADSDLFRHYLSPRVSEALRRRALRRLFHLPDFNIADGLDDYCEDFTGFHPLGDFVSHEMRHMLRRLRGGGTEEGEAQTAGDASAQLRAERLSGDADRTEAASGEEEGPGPSEGEDAEV